MYFVLQVLETLVPTSEDRGAYTKRAQTTEMEVTFPLNQVRGTFSENHDGIKRIDQFDSMQTLNSVRKIYQW